MPHLPILAPLAIAVALQALLPVVVRDNLDGNALVFGTLLGCFGFGAVAGALVNARLRERFHNELIVRMGFAGFALSSFVLAVSPWTAVSAAALLLAGACWVVSLSLFNVTMQMSTPRWVVGRALALYQTGVFGGMAIGSWLWGALSETIGTNGALTGAALVLLAGAMIGFFLPLPDFGQLNLNPLNRFTEPPLRLDLTQRSGPIMIMVDYEIAQEDVQAFLGLMTLRRRIRIRDGAQQWALLRDLENPDLWTETYHVPTWVEYIRHNQRRTQSDAEVTEKLLALHKGPTPLRVHRMIERQTVTPLDDMPRVIRDDPA